MKKTKLFYVLPLLITAIFLSDYAYTRLANFTTVSRAWDVAGPGITVRKDCSACHLDVTPVAQNNVFRVFTFDTGQTAYTPNKVHTIKFKIIATGPVGFSSTVLGNDSNKMVGTIASVDTNDTKVFLHAGSGRYYMNHKEGATTAGVKVYTYTWTAPAAGKGAVTFYFASLSSNNDNGSDFDTTYQNSYVITEALPSTGISEASNSNSIKVFPNPATDRINVSFYNKTNSNTEVSLYSLDGKQAFTLLNENLNAGEQTFNFDLSGNIKPGIYFVKISNDHMNSVKKILFY